MAIAAVGFALRLAWALLTAQVGFGGTTDQSAYVQTARELAEGRALENLHLPPLYPFLLGAVVKVLSLLRLEDLPLRGVVGSVQALVAGLTIVAVGALARRRVSPSAGLIAAGLLAIWPNQVLAASTLLTERIATPLVVAAAVLLLWDEGRPPSWRLWVCGLVAGLAILARPSLLPLVPLTIVLASIGVRTFRERLVDAARVCCSVVLVLIPWFGYTHWLTGELLVFSTSGGFNLCLGNNDQATGGWSDRVIDEECTIDPEVGGDRVERDAALRERAVAWILEHPGEQPQLVRKRFELIFERDHDALAWFPSWKQWEGPISQQTLSRVMDPWWRAMPALTFVGIFFLRRRFRWQVVAFSAAVIVIPLLSVAEYRYKDPLIPFMALAAGAVLAEISRQVRSLLRRESTALGAGRNSEVDTS